MQLIILPRCPAVGLHTVGLQKPLEQHKAGCRTTWPEAPQAGRSSRIQNLHREEHQRNICCEYCAVYKKESSNFKYDLTVNYCKKGSGQAHSDIYNTAADVMKWSKWTKKMSRTTGGLCPRKCLHGVCRGFA